jgi:hypothetical protein
MPDTKNQSFTKAEMGLKSNLAILKVIAERKQKETKMLLTAVRKDDGAQFELVDILVGIGIYYGDEFWSVSEYRFQKLFDLMKTDELPCAPDCSCCDDEKQRACAEEEENEYITACEQVDPRSFAADGYVMFKDMP